MKQAKIKTDYTAKTFSELTENEIFELLSICCFSVKDRMLKHYSNVPMIDKILMEEKNDLISQAYIYASAKSEKYPSYNAFQVCWYSMEASYRKMIDERIGKRLRKRVDGKRIDIGRHIETSLFDESGNEMVMKTKTDKQYFPCDYIELKMDVERLKQDIENKLTESEKTIIMYRLEKRSFKEIGIIKKTNAMNVHRQMQEIRKKLKAYKGLI